MYLVFLGPPGSGKGTQAARLGQALGLPRVATGDMLREAAARKTALGREAETYMHRGDLVPDEVVTGIVRDRIGQEDTHRGFILDGYPRTAVQAAALDDVLSERGAALDMVIYLAVSDDEIVVRLSGRRVCPACGRIYHLRFDPPRREGVCDQCGERLQQRADDSERTVRERLSVYEHQTSPLLGYYRDLGTLREIDGGGNPDEVYQAVRRLVMCGP